VRLQPMRTTVCRDARAQERAHPATSHRQLTRPVRGEEDPARVTRPVDICQHGPQHGLVQVRAIDISARPGSDRQYDARRLGDDIEHQAGDSGPIDTTLASRGSRKGGTRGHTSQNGNDGGLVHAAGTPNPTRTGPYRATNATTPPQPLAWMLSCAGRR
jgi:hypothetical protein